MDKLTFVNAAYIKNLPTEKLYEALLEYLQTFEKDFYENIFLKAEKIYNIAILTELKTRLTTLKEFISLT
jgi:hypothetical protein